MNLKSEELKFTKNIIILGRSAKELNTKQDINKKGGTSTPPKTFTNPLTSL